MNAKTQLDLSQEIDRLRQPMIDLRREFHRQPELSSQEHRTHDRLAERLQSLGMEVRTHIAETGLVGVLRGDKPGRTVMYRADIDALPLNENRDRDYASQNDGAMHACGHDGHMAIALGVAEILAGRRKELPGTVVFCFQPAEETMSGAQPMIEQGVMENPHVETVLGLHLINQLPTGKVVVKPGPTFAACDQIKVEVRGKGGHGAFPHLSIDPITVGSHIVVGMQDLLSREVNAQETAVMTFGQFTGGTKNNIVPETAELKGTLRTFNEEVRGQLLERLGSFVTHIAAAYRAEARLIVECGIPAVDNDVDMTARVMESAVKALGPEACIDGPQLMGSDDMAYFVNQRQGCYYQIGAAIPGQQMSPHHHPGFDIDEGALQVGLKLSVQAVLDALQP